MLTYVDIDNDGREERVWGYVIHKLAYHMISGEP